uniref:S1 RNA-binding domain-containing protein n=1 Tax=Gracilinema caldarium TaxID=215591 RepID=A0A7C3I663_9SPIR
MAKREGNPAGNSFADYMNSTSKNRTQFQPGQMVESRIVSISNDTIFLELNGKSEGILDRAELVDKNGELTLKEGDPIKAFFLKAQNGELHFTTRISGDKLDTAILEEAYKNKIPVEGVVEKEIKGGYEVKIGEARAFCPYSQMGLKRTEEGTNWVGKHLTFIIQEYKDNGRNLIVSNRAIEEALQQEKIDKLKETLKEHSIITGTIKSVQDFGAFVDLGGVQGLIPVSEISRERVENIQEVLQVGKEIRAEIIKLDWKNERITLSMKSLLEDPWTDAAKKFPVGSKHTGRVARITDYGAFVSLEPGLDGLVHVSELRSGGKYNNVKDAVKLGQTLRVLVLEVDESRKRISLKPASSEEEEALSQKYVADGDTEDTYNPFAALLKKK